MIGRRLADTPRGSLPEFFERGDFWRVLDEESGEPVVVVSPTNLTGGCWFVVAPLGEGQGYGLGRLVHHTVREHEDGTISVRPGDGSSNSILITGAHGLSWHGYIEHGVWESC